MTTTLLETHASQLAQLALNGQPNIAEAQYGCIIRDHNLARWEQLALSERVREIIRAAGKKVVRTAHGVQLEA